MADRIGPWRELTGDPTLDSMSEEDILSEIRKRRASGHYVDLLRGMEHDSEQRHRDRMRAIADFDIKIRGEQLLDRVCAQRGHAAYVSWGDAK